MAKTYDPISTQTLGSDTANITFSSIPATYTDLVLVIETKVSASGNLAIQFNTDTATNYSTTTLGGTGSAALSTRTSSAAFIRTAYVVGTTFAVISNTHIQNYANTTTYKSTLTRWNDPSAYTFLETGLWRSTSAINAIKIYNADGGNLKSGAIATLYGIKAA
jgi:hypothetical protein